MSKDNDTEKQGAAPDETVDQFKKDFKKKTDTAVAKWPSQDFGPDVDKLFEFAEKGLKTLTKGNVVLDFLIDFIGKIADSAGKFGLEKLQELLGSKLNKAVKEDPVLKDIVPQEKKEEIEKLNDKLQERAKERDKEASVKAPDTKTTPDDPKAMANTMRDKLEHPKAPAPQSPSTPPANKVATPQHINTGHGGR